MVERAIRRLGVATARRGSVKPRRRANASAGDRAELPTRREILAAAARLFSRQGYAPTTLRNIAGEAGIKAGSIYYHFHGKDEIAFCVLDVGIAAVDAAVRARLDALPADADGKAKIGAAVQGHLWGMLHHSEFTAAHVRIYRYVSDTARHRHAPVRSAYTRLWDELLVDAVKAGALRADMPVRLIRQYLVGALNWPVDWYDSGRGDFEQFAAQITALVCDGITAGATEPTANRPAQRRGAGTRAKTGAAR